MNNTPLLKLCGSILALCLVGGSAAVLHAEPAKSTPDMAKDKAKEMMDKAKDTGKKAVDDAKKKAQDMMGDMSEEQAKAEQRWMEYSAPNDHHARLAKLAGEWDVEMKSWMPGVDAPAVNKVSCKVEAIMDGRYAVEHMKGNVVFGEGAPPMEMEGMAISGYCNHRKMHFSRWIDNMSTGPADEWGTCSTDGKVITTTGDMYDPMTGTMMKTKSVATMIDDNKRTFVMYSMHDGKEFKMMELTYTRKK